MFEDVWDGVAKIGVDAITELWLVDCIELRVCVDVTAGLWLVDCMEVMRLAEDEETNVNVGLKVEVVKVRLDDVDEPGTADWPGLLNAEKGYGSSEVVPSVSQQLGPPRPWPAAPAQHQLLPLDSQRLTSVKPLN